MSMTKCHRTTVLLLDGDERTRDHLKKMLGSRGFEVLGGTASNSDEAVYLCSRLRPEVVVLDISVDHSRNASLNAAARLDSIDATRRITKVCPSTRVIVMARQADLAYLARSVVAGVNGYILKPRVPESLADAIRAVTEGAIVLGADISNAVRDPMPALERRLSSLLT